MARVAVPDYVRFGVPSTTRLFRALTQYPSLQRLLEMQIPTLVVLGERDPLLPGTHRINEIASQTDTHVLVVLLEGAAHAINFSHPDELAHIIRLFMDDRADREQPRLAEPGEGLRDPPRQAPPASRAPTRVRVRLLPQRYALRGAPGRCRHCAGCRPARHR